MRRRFHHHRSDLTRVGPYAAGRVSIAGWRFRWKTRQRGLGSHLSSALRAPIEYFPYRALPYCDWLLTVDYLEAVAIGLRPADHVVPELGGLV